MAIRRNRPILYEVAAAKKRRAGWGLLSNRQAEDEKETRSDRSDKPAGADERQAAAPPQQPAPQHPEIQQPAPVQPAAREAPAPAPIAQPAPPKQVISKPTAEAPPEPSSTPQFQPAPVAVERPHTIPPSHAYHVEEGSPSRRTFDMSQAVILGSILIAITALAWIATMRSDNSDKVVADDPPAVSTDAIQARDLITIPERTAQRPPTEPARPADRSPPTAELPAGHHYIVVQHFPNRRADHAEAAARYLIENGVPCALETGSDTRLLVTTPFLIDQADTRAANAQRNEAERLLARVKALGQDYFRVGGYNFAGAALQKR